MNSVKEPCATAEEVKAQARNAAYLSWLKKLTAVQRARLKYGAQPFVRGFCPFWTKSAGQIGKNLEICLICLSFFQVFQAQNLKTYRKRLKFKNIGQKSVCGIAHRGLQACKTSKSGTNGHPRRPFDTRIFVGGDPPRPGHVSNDSNHQNIASRGYL